MSRAVSLNQMVSGLALTRFLGLWASGALAIALLDFLLIALVQTGASLGEIVESFPFVAAALGMGLLAISFGIGAMRPVISVLSLTLLTSPLAAAMTMSMAEALALQASDGTISTAMMTSVAAYFTPFLFALFRIGRLSTEDRAVARPLPRQSSPLGYMVWLLRARPGLRRSFGASVLGGLCALLSRLLLAALAIGFFYALVFLFSAIEGRAWDAYVMANSLVVLMVGILTGLALRMGARWFSRSSYARQISFDTRPAILFLRSFADDQVRLARPWWERAILLGFGRRRLDHLLVEDFSSIGPIVAIGRPGERQLPFGAARLYVDDKNWQETVCKLADSAAHIILVADDSGGVMWELETMLSPRYRDKLLVLSSARQGDLRRHPFLSNFFEANDQSQERVIAAYGIESKKTLLTYSGRDEVNAYTLALQSYFRSAGA